ncbi:STAG domain-containing protein [Gongronella butleri]|nr:STAG domain-containing protein [Gongronella butleri]
MPSNTNARRTGRGKAVSGRFLNQETRKRHQDEQRSSTMESDQEDEEDQLSSDSDSDSEFKIPASPKRVPSKQKKQPSKRRRFGDASEVTVDSSSQLLEQVSELEERSGLYDNILEARPDMDAFVKDWVQQYTQDQSSALQDLINFVIRCTGCRMAVTKDAFESEDLTVDALQELQEELAKLEVHEYPITSKAAVHKHFKPNLVRFFQVLIESCQHDILYDETLISTLQSWLITMSSSVYRPFRHTSTVIALKIMTSLCQLADNVHKELSTMTRQFRAEENKRGGARNSNKLQLLRKRLQAVSQKQHALVEHIQDFFASLFAHRVRDVESVIRSECLRELGQWLVVFPSHFADNDHFRYLGWSLNDPMAGPRSESLKMISKVFKVETVGNRMESFLTRFMDRLVEMAMYDVDLNTRVHAIVLCHQIFEQHPGWISPEHQASLVSLLQSAQPRIRKAIAPWIKTSIEKDLFLPSVEQVEGALSTLSVGSTTNVGGHALRTPATHASPAVKRPWVAFKSIAAYLASRIDGGDDDESAMDDDNDNDTDARDQWALNPKNTALIFNSVDALWSHVHHLPDYQALADFLTRDHSNDSNSDAIDAYQLTEKEETILVHVFTECLRLLTKKKKDEAQVEIQRNDISNHLVQSLPKLLSKYRGDTCRLIQLVQVPPLMNVNVYLEMRIEDSYKELLQQLCVIYTTMTHPELLKQCALAIQHLTKTTFMSDVSQPIINELQFEVIGQLRDACQGKDLYTARFSRDDTHAVTIAVKRLDHLIGMADICDTMDNELQGASSATAMIHSLVDRASLGYEDEADLARSSFAISFHYLVWRTSQVVDGEPIDNTVKLLTDQRDWLMEKCLEFVKQAADVTPLPEIRRLAFGILVDIYSLFSEHVFTASELKSLCMTCPHATQSDFVLFVKHEVNDDECTSEARADLLITYARALMSGVLAMEQGTLLFDQWDEHTTDDVKIPVKALVEELSTALPGNPTTTELVCRLYLEVLQKSFATHVNAGPRSMDKTLALTRLMCSTFKLADEKHQQDALKVPQTVVADRIHADGIDYCLQRAADASTEEDLAIALKFFRSLSLFAKLITRVRDVGKIRKHMQLCLEQHHLTPSEGDKAWKSYYEYIKVLDEPLKQQGYRYDATRTDA